jgi:hypothetical protein
MQGERPADESPWRCDCALGGVEVLEGLARPRLLRMLEWVVLLGSIPRCWALRAPIPDMSLGPYQLRLSTIAMATGGIGAREHQISVSRWTFGLLRVALSRKQSAEVAWLVLAPCFTAAGTRGVVARIASVYNGERPSAGRLGTYAHRLLIVVQAKARRCCQTCPAKELWLDPIRPAAMIGGSSGGLFRRAD